MFKIDEIGTDSNKGSKKKVADVDCMFYDLKHGIVELSHGDNNPLHVTSCMTSYSDVTTYIPPILAH